MFESSYAIAIELMPPFEVFADFIYGTMPATKLHLWFCSVPFKTFIIPLCVVRFPERLTALITLLCGYIHCFHAPLCIIRFADTFAALITLLSGYKQFFQAVSRSLFGRQHRTATFCVNKSICSLLPDMLY